jgi:hypothetical protein
MMLITPSGTGSGVGTGVGLGVGVNVAVGDGASVGDEALGAGVSLPVAALEGSDVWVGELSACVPPPQAARALPKSTIIDTISNGPFIHSYQVLEPASHKFSHNKIIPPGVAQHNESQPDALQNRLSRLWARRQTLGPGARAAAQGIGKAPNLSPGLVARLSIGAD